MTECSLDPYEHHNSCTVSSVTSWCCSVNRFHGRYEDLNGGISSDSLADVTGGVGRSNHIEHMDSNDREQMYYKLQRDFHWNTLVVCGKNVSTAG